MKEILKKVTLKEDLTYEEAYDGCKAILSGEISDGEIGGFLLALKTKGERFNEIAGMASAMRDCAISFNDKFDDLIDNCGTGGDGMHTFNISTTSSFVLSGAGLRVAKHGNRSISSKSGSSDLLSALGVNVNVSKEKIEELLEKIGIAFLFAPNMHPMMKNVMRVRVALGIPTVFNILGPLAHPMKLESQLLGVYKKELVRDMAEALKVLNRKRAIVINGAGRLDEGSLDGENYVAFIKDGNISESIVRAEDLGLRSAKVEEIRGGTPEENAKITLSILNGEKGVFRDAVLFNSSLGLLAGGKADNLKEALEIATNSIDSGAALNKLNLLIRESAV